jgi:membrane-bound ClpP family serine protease
MTLVILLFSLGILLLAVEVIVPGGILGSIGGLMMFGGCVAAFMRYGTGGGIIAVTVAVALAVLAFYIEFRVLPNTSVGSAFGSEARELIGKSAEALTMLSPSGYVRIDGKRYEAFCQSGQVPAGTPLEVTGADNFRLIVSETKTN